MFRVSLMVSLLWSVCLHGSTQGKATQLARKLVERHIVSKIGTLSQKSGVLRKNLRKTVTAGTLAVGIGCMSLGMSGCSVGLTVGDPPDPLPPYVLTAGVVRSNATFTRVTYEDPLFSFYNDKYASFGYLAVQDADRASYEKNKETLGAQDYDEVFVSYTLDDGSSYIGRAKSLAKRDDPYLGRHTNIMTERKVKQVEVEHPNGSARVINVEQINSVLADFTDLEAGTQVSFALADSPLLSQRKDIYPPNNLAEDSILTGTAIAQFLNGKYIVSLDGTFYSLINPDQIITE